MLALYIYRESVVHRLPPGVKIIIVLLGSIVLFATSQIPYLAALLLGIGALYALAALPAVSLLAALKPVLFICALLFALQLVFAGPVPAIATVLRVAGLVLLTSLVSLTTRLSDMIDALTGTIRHVAPSAVSAPKLALAIGLTIRFIPMLLSDIQEIQNARRTRGARGFGLLAIGPLIIKILRMTDALGNAIAARGFENRN